MRTQTASESVTRACSGHVAAFRNIILKQKHTLVLCTLILAVVQSREISIAEIPGLGLLRIAFVSCSELGCLTPRR